VRSRLRQRRCQRRLQSARSQRYVSTWLSSSLNPSGNRDSSQRSNIIQKNLEMSENLTAVMQGCIYRISGSGFGSAPVVPRNRISEPDNSSAQMSPIKLTKLLVCSGLKPFLARILNFMDEKIENNHKYLGCFRYLVGPATGRHFVT